METSVVAGWSDFLAATGTAGVLAGLLFEAIAWQQRKLIFKHIALEDLASESSLQSRHPDTTGRCRTGLAALPRCVQRGRPELLGHATVRGI